MGNGGDRQVSDNERDQNVIARVTPGHDFFELAPREVSPSRADRSDQPNGPPVVGILTKPASGATVPSSPRLSSNGTAYCGRPRDPGPFLFGSVAGRMDRTAVFVDAGYLFAGGSRLIAGENLP